MDFLVEYAVLARARMPAVVYGPANRACICAGLASRALSTATQLTSLSRCDIMLVNTCILRVDVIL